MYFIPDSTILELKQYKIYSRNITSNSLFEEVIEE